jgi:hypothetical protein
MSSVKMYYSFLCFSLISYILALEGSVGGLLKTFTDPHAPHPLVIVGGGGLRVRFLWEQSPRAISYYCIALPFVLLIPPH